MICGNMVGASASFGKTFILEDSEGTQIVGVAVDEITLFTAEDNDVIAGKIYASNHGVSTGTLEIDA